MANSRGWRKVMSKSRAGTALLDPGEIARMAYHLYEQRGCVDGHDLEDWLQAETIIRQRAAVGAPDRLPTR